MRLRKIDIPFIILAFAAALLWLRFAEAQDGGHSHDTSHTHPEFKALQDQIDQLRKDLDSHSHDSPVPPPVNKPPMADAGPDQEVMLGDDVCLSGAGSSDPEGDAISYVWNTWEPPGSRLNHNNIEAELTCYTPDIAGTFTTYLRVGTAQHPTPGFSGDPPDTSGPQIDSTVITVKSKPNPDPPVPPDPPKPPVPGDLSKLAKRLPGPNAWAEIPELRFQGNPCILDVWNSGAYDPIRHQFYVFGGGHNCYDGVDVWRIDLRDLSLKQVSPKKAHKSLKQPEGHHTYDGLEWVEEGPRGAPGFWSYGQGTGHGIYSQVVFFDSTKPYADPAQWIIGPSRPSGTGARQNMMTAFAPGSMTPSGKNELWTLNGRNGREQTWIAHNPKDGSVIRQFPRPTAIQGGQAHAYKGWFYYAMEQNGRQSIERIDPKTGKVEIVTNLPAGLNYQAGWDIRGTDFVFWDAKRTVYVYDTIADNWTTLSPSGPAPTDKVGQQLVFGKWFYIKELDAFAGYLNPDEGLWLYCLPGGCNKQTLLFEERFNTPPPYADFASGAPRSVFVNGFGSACPSPCPIDLDNGWLRFTSGGGISDAGQYRAFVPETGPGQSVYVAFDYQTTGLGSTDGAGRKLFQIGSASESSCASNELVIQDVWERGFFQMYYGCPSTGSTPFEEGFGKSDIDYQPNRRTCNRNFFNATGSWPPHPECVYITPGSTLSVQLGIDYATTGKSLVRLWVAREGDTEWFQVIKKEIQLKKTYGQVWLQPYNSDVSTIWYDNLRVSRTRLAR